METQTTDTSQALPQTVSDAAWKSMLPFLKAFPNVGNPETCRRFLSAIVWMTKEGASWRALPKVYGYWNTIYRRFGRWCEGVLRPSMNSFTRRVNSRRSSWILQSGLTRCRGPDTDARRIHDETSSVSDDWVPLRWILTSGNFTQGVDRRHPFL